MSSNRLQSNDRKFVMVVPEQFIDSKNDIPSQHQYSQQHHNIHHEQQHQRQQQQQLKIHQEMVHLQQQQQQQLDANNVYLQRFNHHEPLDSNPIIPIPTTTATTSAMTNTTNSNYDTGLTQFDLKSKDSKYKRWTPRMDQYLIKLLSDVAHSYPRGVAAEMNKKAWLYVCKQLRLANPETVYSTYSKYSIQQHLINVIHHRYKIWYKLMVHSKSITSGYSYKWNPELGKFQIIDLNTKTFILDVRQVKLILYSDSLNLPNLSNLNKGNLITNDFFLSDNLRYISVYHNEILPLAIKLDEKFLEGFEDGNIYRQVPKFNNYPESKNAYLKPLSQVKKNPGISKKRKESTRKRNQFNSIDNDNDNNDNHQHHDHHDVDDVGNQNDEQQDRHVVFNQDVLPLEESVDPDLKRARLEYQNPSTSTIRNQLPIQQQQQQQQQSSLPPQRQPPIPQQQQTSNQLQQLQQQQQQQQQQTHVQTPQRPAMQMNIDIESALTSATIAAMNAPPIRSSKDTSPFYIKDAKWFNKLIELFDNGHIRADEVLSICEGVRDNKIPLFMLNVLDHSYYPTRTNDGTTTTAHHRDIPDDETTKRIREFMLPMVYNS